MRRTLLKDLALGTQDMQQNGVLHGDYKTPNVLIGADGRSKIADFGTAQVSEGYRIARSNLVDNPTWLAPEVLKAKTERTAYQGSKHEKLSAVVTDAKAWISGAFSRAGLKKAETDSMLSGMFAREIDRSVDSLSAGGQLDIWAFGVCAHDLLFGHLLMHDEGFVFKKENRLKEFSEDPTNRAVGISGKFTPESSGFEDEEDLINACMHPDPASRPSAEGILNHRAFALNGVGSDAAYDVIKTLMTRDLKDQEEVRAQRLREQGGLLLED